MRGCVRWLVAAAGNRWFDAGCIALAVLLVLPCITVGFAADDAMLRVRGPSGPRYDGLLPTTWDLFVFVRDDATKTPLCERGFLSWWIADGYRLGFLRPLSSLSHAIDLWLWPESAWAMYLVSIAWFVAMLVAARAVFRRLLPAPAAALALVVFAIDDARGPVVGYISNRNALMMACFGFVAIALHDRWRRDGWRPGAVLAPAMLAVGLLAGEGTVAAVGYLVGHALAFERSWRSRVHALLPALLVTVVWAAAYRGLGYGSTGSGIYLDPGSETAAYLAVAPGRIVALLGGQWFGPWSDFWLAYPPMVMIVVGIGYALVLFAIAVVARRLLGATSGTSKGITMLVVGMLLACVPLASTFPADRLLGFVGLGGAGVLGSLLARWSEAPAIGRPADRLIAALVVVHLVLAPMLLVVRSRSMVTVRDALATLDRVVPRDPTIATREVLVALAPNDGLSSYLTVTRVADRVPAPLSAHALATSTGPVTYTRIDARTLELDARDGILTTTVERMVRGPSSRFVAGDVAVVGRGGRATVLAVTDDGRPKRVRFELAAPLHDSRYAWFAWTREGFVAWQPPAIGRSVELAGFDMAHAAGVALGLDP